ncbi:MAG: hypothetical protein GY913_26295, partial [Proteobacteria bacterium]|nr:hypothetical protein [Pseudomonadota bacterium]
VLTDPPPAQRATPEMEVSIDSAPNGILHVKALEERQARTGLVSS